MPLDPKSDRAFLNRTAGASYAADLETKDRARAAELQVRDDNAHPERCFAFNAYLNLAHRGVRTTEGNVIAESKRIAEANHRHFAANVARHAKRAEARS